MAGISPICIQQKDVVLKFSVCAQCMQSELSSAQLGRGSALGAMRRRWQERWTLRMLRCTSAPHCHAVHCTVMRTLHVVIVWSDACKNACCCASATASRRAAGEPDHALPDRERRRAGRPERRRVLGRRLHHRRVRRPRAACLHPWTLQPLAAARPDHRVADTAMCTPTHTDIHHACIR